MTDAAWNPPGKEAASATPPADSPYRIQFAFVTSRAETHADWAKLQATWPETFGTRERIVVERKTEGCGTAYRVQTCGFDTLQEYGRSARLCRPGYCRALR